MKALQLRGLNRLEYTELPLPLPGEGEVLVRTGAATICTSDLHDISYNPFGIVYPRVPGHEGAGTVVRSDGGHFLPGTRVAAHPVVPCGKCGECLRGLGHLCSDMGHSGIDRDGYFAEYFVQRADRLVVIPDDMPWSLGALLEPVAVCLQAVARAGDIRGKKVLVAGDGPFGNIIARLARKAGAAAVIVTGREPFRLGMIRGAEIMHEAPPGSVDAAILAVNAPEAVDACMRALRPRGRLVMFSNVTQPVSIDLSALHVRELELAGACNDENRMEAALDSLKDRSLLLEEIVTHHIPFSKWEDAFDLARNGHDRALKVALTFDHD